MKTSTQSIIVKLTERYPALKDNETAIIEAVAILEDAFRSGGKLLVCGNGGSAADALHIVGELMKGFILPRPISDSEQSLLKKAAADGEYIGKNLQSALPAISLVNEVSLISAYANDKTSDLTFAQQVYGYGNRGDVLFAISTSGNSVNVLYACEVAQIKGVKVIGLTGASGGRLNEVCDVTIKVPETETYKIQELHLPVYHAICMAVENEQFGVFDGKELLVSRL